MRRQPDRKKDANRPARLRILDKEVQIGCKPGEEDDLLQAAAYVDKSMRDLRRRNTTSSIEKIAIVAAINTANALLKSRSLEGSMAAGMPTAGPGTQAVVDNQGAAVPLDLEATDSSQDDAAAASEHGKGPVAESAATRESVEDTIAARLQSLNSRLDELLQSDVANRKMTAE